MEFKHLQSFHPETRMGRGGNRSVMANFDSSPRLLRRKSHEWRGVKLIYWGSILVRIVLENEDNKTETWRSGVSGIRARNLTLNLFTWGSRFLSVFLQSVAIKDIFIMRTRTLWAPRPTADTKARGEFQMMTNLYFSTLVSLCLNIKRIIHLHWSSSVHTAVYKVLLENLVAAHCEATRGLYQFPRARQLFRV